MTRARGLSGLAQVQRLRKVVTMKRSIVSALAALIVPVLGCNGSIGQSTGRPAPRPNGTAGSTGTGTGTAGSTGLGGSGIIITTGSGGGGVVTPPFEPVAAAVAVRKVKNLLTGMAATDADVMTVTTNGAGGLQTLINTWMTDSQYAGLLPGEDGDVLPELLPADGVRAARRLQAAAADQRRVRLRTVRPRGSGRRRVLPTGAEPPGQLRADGVADGGGKQAVHGRADDAAVHDDDGAQEPLRPGGDEGGRAVREHQRDRRSGR